MTRQENWATGSSWIGNLQTRGKDMETAQDLGEARDPANVKVCIVGASGKLGRYMAQHALDGVMRWSACAGSRAWRNSMRSRGA